MKMFQHDIGPETEEYMLHIWGGAWNDNATPSIEADFGVEEGYHYFKTKESLNSFLEIINKPEYKTQGLMTDLKYGQMTHKRTIFVGTFKYNDEEFVVHYDFGFEYPEKQAIFQFTENNYACDCNRSLFIREEYGKETIPELCCGNKIELLHYHFEYLNEGESIQQNASISM